MDVMQIRRMLMNFGGGSMGNAQCVEGTFIGDGTQSVTLSVGFAPDMLSIETDVDYEGSGWIGIGNIVLIKGSVAFNAYHGNSSSTNTAVQINNRLGGTYGDYGDSSSAQTYRAYGTYSDGSITVQTKGNNDSMKLINGKTYTWKAFKKN